jgi:hypothetical protein
LPQKCRFPFRGDVLYSGLLVRNPLAGRTERVFIVTYTIDTLVAHVLSLYYNTYFTLRLVKLAILALNFSSGGYYCLRLNSD